MQDYWQDLGKSVLTGKFIALNAYIEKKSSKQEPVSILRNQENNIKI